MNTAYLMRTAPSTRLRVVPRMLLGSIALSTVVSGCASLREKYPVPDGTEAAPFDARDVDVAPKIVGCGAGLTWLRSGIQLRGVTGNAVSFVVNTEGHVVPGSVGRRRRGSAVVRARSAATPPGLEQDVLTCRYEPGVRHGTPVAVHTTQTFFYP